MSPLAQTPNEQRYHQQLGRALDEAIQILESKEHPAVVIPVRTHEGFHAIEVRIQ